MILFNDAFVSLDGNDQRNVILNKPQNAEKQNTSNILQQLHCIARILDKEKQGIEDFVSIKVVMNACKHVY